MRMRRHPSHALHVVSAPGGPRSCTDWSGGADLCCTGLGRGIHWFSTCPRSSSYVLGSAQWEAVKMGNKDTLLVLTELSQAGGTQTPRQMALSSWIHAFIGELRDALGTQRRRALNPVQRIWLRRASWRKWYPKLTLCCVFILTGMLTFIKGPNLHPLSRYHSIIRFGNVLQKRAPS